MTCSIKVVQSADYYLRNVCANYYSEGGDAPGRWFGGGAIALKLGSTVDRESFERLLAGLHPRLDKSLVQTGPVAHRPGFDVTFNVSKTVSAAWALADPLAQLKYEAAADRASRTVMGWLEDNVALTRRGKGGRIREKAKLVLASFDHVQNRNGDPQLHRHFIVANVCQREDGTWGTVDSKTLYSWVRTLGPMFRACLAQELKNSLGLELVDGTKDNGDRAGWFEIAGVPETLADKWSSRRNEMLKALEGEGQSLGGNSAKARANATLSTRKAKEENLPRPELFARWKQEAAEYGFTPEHAAALLGRAQPTVEPDAFPKAWQDALEKITLGQAHFTERLLIQEVCEQLQTGQFNGIEIANRVQEQLANSPEIIRLKDAGADRQFTTKAMWNLEEKLLMTVEAMKSRPGAQLLEEQVGKTLLANKHLDPEQRKAVQELLTSKSAIRTMQGVAGAGKSTTLKAVKEGFEAAGYTVVGATLSGVAKEELAAKTGMRARTIASYEHQWKEWQVEKSWKKTKHVVRQYARAAQGKSTWNQDNGEFDRKTVLIVDEAWMNGSRILAQILERAEKAGATIVFAGDGAQLQPIEAGSPMRMIASAGPTSTLTINRRQKEEADREAVQAVRDGEALKALKSYADRGAFSVGENRRDAIRLLVEAWKEQGGTRRPEDFAAFVPTKAEAREINRLCQEARLAAARTPHKVSLTNGVETFYRGDRVMFHKAARELGAIENGTRGTIVSIHPLLGTANVRLDQAPAPTKFSPKPSRIVAVPVALMGKELGLAYASTTHKGQSQTVKNSLILMTGSMVDRELAYTQVTRAAGKTSLFVDKAHVGDELKDLIAAVEKSRAKTMAHEHGRHEPKSEKRPGIELQITRET
jgi:conjugative relaxase-like TrwC/TraI family protein